MRPLKAIRAKCLDCSAGQAAEVRRCPLEKCPLYPYRMWHRPKQSSYTPETPNAEKTLASPHILGREDAKQ